MSHFLGITRDPQFSPGKIDADRRVLEGTASCLRSAGHRIDLFAETDREWPQPAADTVVFTMSQGRRALQQLREWEHAGVRIINRPEGILNCQRHRTVLLLAGCDVGFPRTCVVGDMTAPKLSDWIQAQGAWVKRGDVHAIEADDVVFVENASTAQAVLERLHHRGVERAVVQEHLSGRVVKFYAVRDLFFHCVLPAQESQLDAATQERIDTVGRLAADALDVEVYGGDCVIRESGEVCLIDLNDWPSYSACLTEASQSIAAYLQKAAAS